MQDLLARGDVLRRSDGQRDPAPPGAELQAGVGAAGVVEEAEDGEQSAGDLDLLHGLNPGARRTWKRRTTQGKDTSDECPTVILQTLSVT